MAKKIETLNDIYVERMRLEKKAEKIEDKLSVEFKNIADSVDPVMTVVNLFKKKPSAAGLIPLIVSSLVKKKGSIWSTAAMTVAEYVLANVDTSKVVEKIIKMIPQRKKREKKTHIEP